MPWPDAMMPIGPNYIAAERAILECAWAGCETIWVVCNQDISRVLKNKIGDFVFDPVRSYFKHKTPEGFDTVMFKKIPIYYVPVLLNKRHKTSLPYSVIQGAYYAYHTSYKMSKWLLPAMYYVAFPYGVYAPKQVSINREKYNNYENYLHSSKDGKTVLDNEYLGFTFSRAQFIKFKEIIHKRKIDKSWIDYTLDDVFNKNIITDYNQNKVYSYYNIGSWQQYCNFLGSKETKYYNEATIKKYFTKTPYTLYGIEDGEEDEQDGNV